MTDARFVVGIDLGTTHCVMAVSPAHRAKVSLVEVPQLIAPGEVAPATVLPSFLYLPVAGELAASDLALPWSAAPEPYAVGEIARRLGAKSPGRLVASAKSWICYGGVNRRAAVLPWGAPDSDPHVSPYEASVRYLAHLRAAWEAEHPDARLADQDVIVTVPASFDDGARELTSAAAREAGLGVVRLIEEPQAAFYDFLAARTPEADALLRDARLVLIVDVGGGTTDLTLLRVLPPEAQPDARDGSAQSPQLERIAVGGHLMLGGDNMDAALARHVAEKAGVADALDASEWSALMQAARATKERLLVADAPAEATVAVQRRGSRLVGSTRTVTLARDEVRALLVDGFLPLTAPTEVASRTGRAGLTTAGLPYVSDPAISRHVSAFLRGHVEAARAAGARVDATGLPRPDFVLLNGGVFNARALVERFAEVLRGWFGEPVPLLLAREAPEAAVARGAVRFGLARRGVGDERVIAGGTARAYYVGVAGGDGAQRALCIAPRGMDDGATVTLSDRIFSLVLEQPVSFALYASTSDRADAAGTLVASDDPELEPLPPLQTVLSARGGELVAGGITRSDFTGTVPVNLSATVNEKGALEIHLSAATPPARRWRLSFALGADASGPTPAVASAESRRAAVARTANDPLPPRFAEAQRALRAALARSASEEHARRARADLEALLGARGEWSASTCRALWDLCMQLKADRAHTPAHELTWLRLVGWCMRPGLGAPGDAERMRAMWRLHDEGLAHPTKANWSEWWITWRRVAPGLDRAQQLALFEHARPLFAPDAGAKSGGQRPSGQAELLQLLAGLERLPPADKERVGEWFLQRATTVGSYWALGRLGARVPFHGEREDAVPARVAESWLARLLALDWKKSAGAAFACAMIARASGDPARDINAELRRQVADRLRATNAPASWLDMVMNAAALSASDLGHALGESLPPGLRLT